MAFRIFLTIFVGKRHFNEFGGHTKKSGNPHPEQRCWSTQVYGQRNTTNVPGTHRARDGRRQGLEVSRVSLGAWFIEFTAYHTPCVGKETDLGKFEVYREKQTRTEEHEWKVLSRTH
jgi:hypothetical protein